MADPSLYAVMTSLESINARQTAQANNLVNANTPGFRTQLSTLIAAPIHGPMADTGQADAIAGANGYSRKPGAFEKTGSAWNVAITGSGWLTTRNAAGQLLLTRDGRLHLGSDGLLKDSQGNDVLGANLQPISLPSLQSLKIGNDGTVSGVPAGGGSQLTQQFNRLYIAATPATPLRRLGGARFGGITNPQALTRSAAANVQQGYLEASDVKPVKVMTSLISGVRNFQIATQMQQSSNAAQATLNALVSRG